MIYLVYDISIIHSLFLSVPDGTCSCMKIKMPVMSVAVLPVCKNGEAQVKMVAGSVSAADDVSPVAGVSVILKVPVKVHQQKAWRL